MIFARLVETPPPGGRDGPDGAAAGAGSVGMWLLLGALSTLFASGALIFFYFRFAGTHPWDRLPLPPTLWIATGVLLLSSLTMHLGLLGAKWGRRSLLLGGLGVTTLLGLAFLALQWHNWAELRPHFDEAIARETTRFAAEATAQGFEAPQRVIPKAYGLFFLMTGLHGAHVVGGLVPLLWVTIRALRGHYGPQRHAGVSYTAMYWHFLDVIWLLLLAMIVIGR